jgi:hypothetical protein
MRAVSNATPLIWLSHVSRFGLLRDLFSTVVITPEVHAETVERATGYPNQANVRAAVSAGWIVVQAPPDDAALATLKAQLHAGEAETLALARHLGEIVLVDDLHARHFAAAMGLRVLGTAGILLMAHRRGLAVDVKETLDKMIALGFRMTPDVYRRVMSELHSDRTD